MPAQVMWRLHRYLSHPGWRREFGAGTDYSREDKDVFFTLIDLLNLVQARFERDLSKLKVRRRKENCFVRICHHHLPLGLTRVRALLLRARDGCKPRPARRRRDPFQTSSTPDLPR